MNKIDDLRQRLIAQTGQVSKIARESGISYSWLSKFKQGEITNPTLRRMIALEKALNSAQQHID